MGMRQHGSYVVLGFGFRQHYACNARMSGERRHLVGEPARVGAVDAHPRWAT
jgi:hypothetical protein